VGGNPADFAVLEKFLASFSSGLFFGGAPGAGHFIKTIHNGIEYGFLQALGEGLAVLDAALASGEFSFDLSSLCQVWNNGSIIESRLTADAAVALKEGAAASGKIGGGQTGTWALQEGQKRNISMPALAAALAERKASERSPGFASRLIAQVRHVFGQHDLS
jgi:6-phosphogluconate dehydrogenase